jgi:ABC-type multidrug transport system ATPase subunit
MARCREDKTASWSLAHMANLDQPPSWARAGALSRETPSLLRSGAAATDVEQDRLPLAHGLTFGREAMPGQVVLDHPTVSGRHAAFEVADGNVVLRDLGSTNGTYVNGVLLHGVRLLAPGDRIDIGPFALTFDGTSLTKACHEGHIELLVEGVSCEVLTRGKAGRRTRILHPTSLRVRPSEFVAIIGVNGSGKSTLMNIMAGRAIPSEGSVLLNGADLHANFERLKRDIAFVSQRDALHGRLTVRQALDYAARLRLPPDTTGAQRRAAVHDAARSVGLLGQLDQHISALSGGQKKCAILASEILSRPSLLLLDEVTSGLDVSSDWDVMRLLRRLAEEGMTIVVVTHSLASATEFCDKILCIARNGHPAFFGGPAEVLDFFGVRRIGDVLSRMDEFGPEYWHAGRERTAFAAADLPTTGDRSAEAPRANAKLVQKPPRVPVRTIVRQCGILLDRNTRLLLFDRRTLVMAAIQSVLIGGLVGYAFHAFGTGQERVGAQSALLLLLGLSAIWLGCNGASKEIVGELAVYRRERDVNLSTAAFVCAKFVVSGAFAVLQLAIVYLLTAVLSDGIPGDLGEQFLLLTTGALTGTAIGLVISAFANTRDQATTIVPLALVPQLVLAGVLVPNLPDLAEKLAKVVVSGYWLTEAMKSVFLASEGPIRIVDLHTGALIDMTAQPAALGAAILAMHALAFLLLAYVTLLLRHGRRSPRSAVHRVG